MSKAISYYGPRGSADVQERYVTRLNTRTSAVSMHQLILLNLPTKGDLYLFKLEGSNESKNISGSNYNTNSLKYSF